MAENPKGTATAATSKDKREHVLMDKHGFSREEAEAAIAVDTLGRRSNQPTNINKTRTAKPSRGDDSGQTQTVPPARVKTTRHGTQLPLECTFVPGARSQHIVQYASSQTSSKITVPFETMHVKQPVSQPGIFGMLQPSSSLLADDGASESNVQEQTEAGDPRKKGVGEAAAQNAITYKKKDIAKPANPGAEWDVVSKDQAGEEDWLAVEVEEMTAKMMFFKVEAEKL